MRRCIVQLTSLFIFVLSMLAIFTGLLSIYPEPLFPADQAVSFFREIVFWVLGTDEEIVPYIGNLLCALVMFTLCALLGDVVDMIGSREKLESDGKSFEYLMRFLYSE